MRTTIHRKKVSRSKNYMIGLHPADYDASGMVSCFGLEFSIWMLENVNSNRPYVRTVLLHWRKGLESRRYTKKDWPRVKAMMLEQQQLNEELV